MRNNLCLGIYVFWSLTLAGETSHLAGSGHLVRPSSTLKQSREAQVEQIFTSAFRPNTPGCTVSIEQNGRIFFERAYGSASLQRPLTPLTPHTQMRIASITKPLVATAVLILRRRLMANEGDLLKKRLDEIYPEFRGLNGFNAVTVRHLLEHTSSLIRDIDESLIPASATEADVPQMLRKLGNGAFSRFPLRRIHPPGM